MMRTTKTKIETHKMHWCAMTLYETMNSTKKEAKKSTTRRERKGQDVLAKHIEKYCHLTAEEQKGFIKDLLKKLNKYKMKKEKKAGKKDKKGKKKEKEKAPRKNTDMNLNELCELINLVLLRPDFKHDLKIRKQTPMQKLFTIWMKSKGEKKQVISQLLATYIASHPDLTAISNASASAHYQLMLYMLLSYGVAWKMRAKGGLLHDICVVPLLQMSLFASSVMVGTYSMRYIRYKLNSLDQRNQLDVEAGVLTGSYTRHSSVLQYKNSIGVVEQISSIKLSGDEQKQEDVKTIFLRSRNLLHKYAAYKRSPGQGWINGWFRRSNLQEISQGYSIERAKLTEALKDRRIEIFEEDKPRELAEMARDIFISRNFDDLKASVREDKHNQKEIIAFYEMVDKGVIPLDIEAAYILHELVQSIIFPQYQSPLGQQEALAVGDNESTTLDTFLNNFHQIYKGEKREDMKQTQRVMIFSMWKETQKLLSCELISSDLFNPLHKEKSKNHDKLVGEYGSFVNIVDACMAYMDKSPKFIGNVQDQADIIGVLLIASVTYIAASSMLRLPFLASVCYLCFKPQIDTVISDGIELYENMKSRFDNVVNVLYNAPQYAKRLGSSIKEKVVGASVV